MWKQRLAPLYSILLPVLGGIYPVIFLYGHNVKITPLSSLTLPLCIVALLALFLFGLFFLFERNRLHAGLSAFVFLIFFHTYGMLHARMENLNVVQIEHYTLLPLVILIALYGAFFIHKLSNGAATRLQTILILLSGGLVLINLIPVIPAEIGKAQSVMPSKEIHSGGAAIENAPDIYFIILDEYAGFDALEGYWKDDYYKEFIAFLEDKNFYVAEHSQSYYTDSLYEVSSRLNLTLTKNRKSPARREAADYQALFESIADNKVMRLLKSYGYSTVVFDGLQIPYGTKPDIIADYNFKLEDAKQNIRADEFTLLFLEQTMILAVPEIFKNSNLPTQKNREMILTSLEKIEHLEEVSPPKFVYLHLMIPHLPLLFNENGWALDFKNRLNWNYYLGQHKYATRRAEELVSHLLENADPTRPPVIILQSDHGARNLKTISPDYVGLENYDDKYKTSILNVMHIPGYDYSTLTKDLSPIEPLVIVLNHYFHAGVEVEVVDEGN